MKTLVDTMGKSAYDGAMTTTHPNAGPFAGSRFLASGLLVEVDAMTRKATPVVCDWLVEVASGNPEPDSIEDTVKIVECGAKVRRHPGYPDATICDHGHDRLPIEVDLAPFGPAWQREQEEDHPCLVHGPGDDECLGPRCITGKAGWSQASVCIRHGNPHDAQFLRGCWECDMEAAIAKRDREEG